MEKIYNLTVKFKENEVTLPVKVPQRPEMLIQEVDGKITKQSWLPFLTKMTNPSEEHAKALFDILARFYEVGAENFKESNSPAELMANTKLGSGKIEIENEVWEFEGIWPRGPHTVSFGKMCYSSSIEVDIEITWRFLNIKYSSTSLHPN